MRSAFNEKTYISLLEPLVSRSCVLERTIWQEMILASTTIALLLILGLLMELSLFISTSIQACLVGSMICSLPMLVWILVFDAVEVSFYSVFVV